MAAIIADPAHAKLPKITVLQAFLTKGLLCGAYCTDGRLLIHGLAAGLSDLC
jgi:hypothetical protein